MAEASPKRRSVNYDIIKIVKNYLKMSSASEIRHDLLIPFIVSFIIGILVCKLGLDMFNVLQEVNNIVITVMSILAGFNTASIAIISANPQNFIDKIEDVKVKGQGEKLLNSLTSYFSYAIIVQLSLLITGIIASVFLKFISIERIPDSIYLDLSLSFIFIIWFTIVIHSLLITLRNVSILHNYILFIGKIRS